VNLPPLNARVRALRPLVSKPTGVPVVPGHEGQVYAAQDLRDYTGEALAPEVVIVVHFDHDSSVTWETLAAFYADCEVLGE
jgi:hypothetical protein